MASCSEAVFVLPVPVSVYLADYWLIPEKASLVPILVLVPNGLACCCAYTAQVLVLGAIMKD